MTPTTVPSDVPPLDGPQRRGVLEVDAFCAGCQYNLHGQPVTVDERLQLPVCRCPECGRFHPAGVGVSASGVWLRRLATLALAAWVGVVLATAVIGCYCLGALDVVSVEFYSVGVRATLADPPRPYKPAPVGGKMTSTGSRFLETIHPILGGPLIPDEFRQAVTDRYDPSDTADADRLRNGPGPVPWVWMAAASGVAGAVVGSLTVTFLWHWPRRRYLWALVNPAVAAAVVVAGFTADGSWILCQGTVNGRILGMAAVQCGGVLVGILVGRPVARGLLRAVVPPRPRQALAFLWQVDGKPMPVPRA